MNHALYNEIEPFAADWLDSLIAAGHIAPGRVDRRSIVDLAPADVAGPGQRHFFAGIGGWSYALRLAGIPDDADIWTGSCPCQPFSSAGKGLGVRDPRHLWPTWFALIEQCRPPVVFGEQVASRDGLAWLDLVFADLERCGYAVGAADLCAAGVGAPHIRQRLYFVAYADAGHVGESVHIQPRKPRREMPDVERRSDASALELVDAAGSRHSWPQVAGADSKDAVARIRGCESERAGAASFWIDGKRFYADGTVADYYNRSVANPDEGERRSGRGHSSLEGRTELRGTSEQLARCGDVGWSPVDWLPCTDGVSRPIEPGTFPLAHGVPGRVGRLRGYGNAIVPQVAAVFIQAAIGALT